MPEQVVATRQFAAADQIGQDQPERWREGAIREEPVLEHGVLKVLRRRRVRLDGGWCVVGSGNRAQRHEDEEPPHGVIPAGADGADVLHSWGQAWAGTPARSTLRPRASSAAGTTMR